MVVPGAVSISQAQAKRLADYVQAGGILIADGRIGAIDDRGCVPPEGIPGSILSELFGVVEEDITSGENMIVGDSLLETGFESQELELIDDRSQVLARMENGLPAIVMHRFGKGKTIYCNNFEGLVLLQHSSAALEDIFHDLLSQVQANASAPFVLTDKDEHVHVSCIESESHRGMLIVNFSDVPQTVTVYGLPAGAVLKDLFTGKSVSVERDGTAHPEIASGAHAVYMWEK